MHAASRVIICSFFMSRHFYGAAGVYDGSHGWVGHDESTPFFYDVTYPDMSCTRWPATRFNPRDSVQAADRCSAPITRALAHTREGKK